MTGSALVLLAHGARDPDWARPFRQLVAALGERLPGERIVLAFLEIMRPSLADCVAALHGEGIRHFRVVPVFLGSGGHVKEDLAGLADALRREFPDLDLQVEPPVGERPAVIDAIAQAIASMPPAPRTTRATTRRSTGRGSASSLLRTAPSP